jgi:hypothetical protein
VEAKTLNFHAKSGAGFSYSRILRCIGQSLETFDLKSFDLKCQGTVYLLQGVHKGTSTSVDLELQYTPDDIKRLDSEGRKKRQGLSRRSNPLNLSQLLRTAGNYVDQIQGRLRRVSWQYQADKIQALTIQYEPGEHEPKEEERPTSTIDEICVHIYKQRKKIPGTLDR